MPSFLMTKVTLTSPSVFVQVPTGVLALSAAASGAAQTRQKATAAVTHRVIARSPYRVPGIGPVTT